MTDQLDERIDDVGERGVERLLADVRVMGESGIERAAWGWERHAAGDGQARFQAAEREALRVLQIDDRGPEWDELRRRILELTEGTSSLVSWRAEHGDLGHRAERAVLGAGMALLADEGLSPEDQVALMQPLDEVLPWLLPEVPPEPAP